jgi:hypothetical protein
MCRLYIDIYCACIYVFNCVLSIVAKGESTNIRRMLASNNDDKTKRLVLKMFSSFQHKKDTAVQQDSSFSFHTVAPAMLRIKRIFAKCRWFSTQIWWILSAPVISCSKNLPIGDGSGMLRLYIQGSNPTNSSICHLKTNFAILHQC